MKAEELEIQQENNSMQQVSMFDDNGRCLPQNLESAAHKTTRRYFLPEQPELDFEKCYSRLNTAFAIEKVISCEEFKSRVAAIQKRLAANETTKNVLKGVMVPFILPKASYTDIGLALEQTYLPAVAKAFNSVYSDYSFTNHSPRSLTEQLQVVQGSRHDTLLAAMTDDVVVGVYFPSLLEYSVPAAVEQVQYLPNTFLLAGGFDTCAAFISMPDLLLKKDGYPPLLWLSGLQSVEPNVGYHFEAYGYDLTFNRRVHLGHVAEYWASALVALG